MRLLLLTAIAAMAMSAGAIGAAQAQSNCPVTETTSIGPNGETIIRREACGAVEIITRPAPTTTSTTTTTSSRNRSTTTTTSGPNNPPPTTNASTPPSGGPGGVLAPSNRNTATINTSREAVMSSSPPPPGAGGWNPGAAGDPMALRRPVARLVLFDANNFRGRNIGITQNTPNLERRRFADVASTARSQGGVWELCTEPNYGGTCVTTDTDLDLSAAGVDNSIASVRLIRP